MTPAEDARPAGAGATSVLVEDRVRQRRVAVPVVGPVRVGAFVAGFVREHGLPVRTLDGEPIHYALSSADGGSLADDDELDTDVDRVLLDSEVATSTWQQMSKVVAAIETELGTTYRADAKAAVEQRVELVREHLRAEALRRVKGAGSTLDWRARGRVRRLAAQLGLTDAFPEDADGIVRLMRVAGPLAGTATRVVAPLAAVGVVAAGGSYVGSELADQTGGPPSAEAIAAEVVALLPRPPQPVGGDTGQLDATQVAEEVVALLPLSDRLATSDLAALLADLAAALEEADPATAPVLGGITRDPPTEVTAAGGSLWEIAAGFRDDLLEAAADPASDAATTCDVPTEYTEPVGTYVLRVWAANLDAVGADPDVLEVGTVLRMPCPR